MFPFLEIQKENRKWMVTVVLGKEIVEYSYPFYFPKAFMTYKTKHDLEVRLQFLECISVNSLIKTFVVEDFLNRFSIENGKKSRIKKLIIKYFGVLEKSGFIEEDCQLIYKNGSTKKVKFKDLTPLLITRSKYINFTEKI